MQGLQSKARALQQQLEAQGEQLRAETRRADEAVAAAAAGGADQEAVAKLRKELEASQAAQRTYREEAAVAKMALERKVKDLERSLEASRQEHARDRDELQTSRRELEEAKARAAKGAGAAALEEELGGVRAQLEQAEGRAAEERAAAAAAAAAAAEAQGELAKLTKLTAELTKLTQAQAELEGTPGPASVAVAAASRHAASQVSRPASGVGGNSGAPEPGGGVPPALAQQLVEGLAAAAGAAEAAVAERLATCEARVGAALSQLGRARDEAKRVAGRLRAETRRAEVAEAAAAAAGGGGEDAIVTEARLRAAALAEAEAEARSRDLAIEIAELRRASSAEAAAVAQALREKADEIAELRTAAEARAAADALAAASPFKQWEAAPEVRPDPPQGAADAGEAAAALEKLHGELRRVKRERFWVRCLVVSLSHTVELCKEELEGSQQQASQGAAALQQASDQLLQEKVRLEAMADKHAQLQHNLELAAAAATAAPPPAAPEAEAWRTFCAELTPETKLQADSRQLEQGAPGTVWNPDTSLTGRVVWVCPSGDTLELSFLGSSPPVDGRSSPLLEQHPSLNPAATAIAAAASIADHAEHDGEYAWVSREASLERRGSLLSLMTAAAPVDGGSSVGAKEQVRALLEPKPLQPHARSLQPHAHSLQPHARSLQPHAYRFNPMLCLMLCR